MGGWGVQFIGGRARFSTGLLRNSLSFMTLRFFPSSRAVGLLEEHPLEGWLCMHRSVRHALMFRIYSQAVHKTRASNVSPQVSSEGGRRAARICCSLIKD